MSVTIWNTDQIAALIVERVPDVDDAATWVAVVLAESGRRYPVEPPHETGLDASAWFAVGGDPVAYNLVDGDPTAKAYLSTDNGLFQVNSFWHGAQLPVHLANRPAEAWEYSWRIATGNGEDPSDWSPWVAYRTGAYQDHLEAAYAAAVNYAGREDATMDLYEPAPGFGEPPAGGCRVGMVQLADWLLAEYPADQLGCYVDRPVTGGSSPSLHRDGRAIDIGFIRDLEAREEAVAKMIEHADELGLQMILNYRSGEFGGYRWRLPYSENEQGYEPVAPWSRSGHWLHIERTNAGADDPRPIAEIIAAPEPPDPTPPPEVEHMFRFRHVDYADQFSCGASGAMHMTPGILEHYDHLPLVENDDREWLIHCCNDSGFDFARLTPI